MKIYRTLRTAFRALRRNPMRATLTILGIVIGVAAVIAMMEIGNGSSAEYPENHIEHGRQQPDGSSRRGSERRG